MNNDQRYGLLQLIVQRKIEALGEVEGHRKCETFAVDFEEHQMNNFVHRSTKKTVYYPKQIGTPRRGKSRSTTTARRRDDGGNPSLTETV